jgi:hypothetical protein
MAVLIQPFVEAEAGGLAWVEGSRVVIEWVPGSPAGLLAGHQVGRREVVEGEGEGLTGLVAGVARAASERVGATQMEWLATEGEVRVVQLAAPLPVAVAEPGMEVPADPGLLRVARIVRRFSSPIEEKLVLPWAIALEEPSVFDSVEPLPGGDQAMIEALAEEQIDLVWGGGGYERAAIALAVLAGDPFSVLGELRGLGQIDLEAGRRIVALTRGLPVSVPGRSRFEPLGAAVTEAFGDRKKGVGASGGLGFGLGSVVLPQAAVKVGPRRVIVAPEPIPHLAPLLWSAAGLLTLSGSPAAHLFESARSLGVPAVAAADLELSLFTTGSWAVAVNGAAGTVSVDRW